MKSLVITYVNSLGAAGPKQGERVLAPLRALGTVLIDLSGVVQWTEAQQFFDADYPRGGRYHWKSAHLSGLGDDAVDVLLDMTSRRPSTAATLDIWFNGGAISDVPATATPISTRAFPVMIGIEANWTDPAADRVNREWSQEVAAALKPHSAGGAYLNFDDLTDPDAARLAHGKNYDRLVAVQRSFDPHNVFRSRRGATG